MCVCIKIRFCQSYSRRVKSHRLKELSPLFAPICFTLVNHWRSIGRRRLEQTVRRRCHARSTYALKEFRTSRKLHSRSSVTSECLAIEFFFFKIRRRIRWIWLVRTERDELSSLNRQASKNGKSNWWNADRARGIQVTIVFLFFLPCLERFLRSAQLGGN